METENPDDIWQLPSASAPAQSEVSATLNVVTLGVIAPIDGRQKIIPEEPMPKALQELLFDQPSGRDPSLEPLNTYAILDAAKANNLLEMIEASELENRCFFKGEAFEELKDVAPWIVALDKDNKFVQGLLTQGRGAWQLWDNECGIFLRSSQDIDALLAHFRKFTKAKDENGQFYYVRFWEPRWTQTLLGEMGEKGRMSFVAPIHDILCISDSQATLISCAEN